MYSLFGPYEFATVAWYVHNTDFPMHMNFRFFGMEPLDTFAGYDVLKNPQIAAVSADSEAQLREHQSRLDVNFPLFYGLTLEQMENLGLYISIPRSEKETDHNFAEPGLFVINSDAQVQVVDLSNNPFARPDLKVFVSGLEWIRKPENNYPVRGTYA